MQQNENKTCGVTGCSMNCKHGKMMMKLLMGVIIIGGGYFFFAKDNAASKDTIKKSETKVAVTKNENKPVETPIASVATVTAGSYEVYDASKIAKAKTGKVILFFRASWCPSCKALDKDIREHLKDIPEDVTILDVDYDKYTDLKKQYGVVMQHTLVQVDADGKEMKKWQGIPTLADVLIELKK